MFVVTSRARRLVDGVCLAAISFALQACGGGGSTSEASSPTYDLQAAMAQYYAKGNSWTLAGSVLVEGKPTPATMTVSTQPASGVAAVPVSGKSYPFIKRSTTYNVAGFPTQTIADRLFFDPTNQVDVAMAADSGKSCSSTLIKRPLPTRASIGDSGEGNSGVDYVSCQSGELVEASYTESWVLKQEGARVLLCVTDIRKSVANAAISTGTQCFQINSDSSLGAFSSLVTQEPQGGMDLRTQ